MSEPEPRDHSIAITVPPDLSCFPGHFPGDPLVPGAGLVALFVLPRLRRLVPHWGDPRSVRGLKFRNPVRPGAALTLRISLDDGARRARVKLLTEAGPALECGLQFPVE